MDRKGKELPPKTGIPLLEEAKREKIEFAFYKKRRLKRWYYIYMGTTMTAIALCLVVLIVGLSGGAPLFSGKTVSAIATGLARLDFMDLSGYGSAREEGWEESVLPDILDGFLLPGDSLQDPPVSVPDTAIPSPGGSTPVEPPQSNQPPLTLETLYQFDYDSVPQGETPIVPMDLSLTSYGTEYIHNSTGLTPDTKALLKRDWEQSASVEYLSASKQPLVLIVHTHGTESYSEDGAVSYVDDGGELARSTDPSETVVAVGKTLADSLNKYGISTVHCTVMHDELQYKDSYARAEETIKEYLKRYPSIRLVIDVHRDSIVKSTGELVRPVTLVDGEAAAQVMCVVGSDWGGESNPNWEGNLSLALKLREALNQKNENLCRPAYLRSSTYNQELAPYSLLLEVGASGNSLQEAQRAVEAVAEVLAGFVPKL